jgi:transposase
VVLVGVEGTGSYGAGLTRYLQGVGVRVVEVDRPNRQQRRRAGKSDTQDAVSAARAALAGDALGVPKCRDGNVEAIRVVRVARTSARRDRTRALNQMRSLIATAPDELRGQLRRLTIPNLVRTTAGFRPAGRTDITNANRLALKTLARRVLELDDEIDMLDEFLTPLVTETAPEMVQRVGSAPTPRGHCSSPPARTPAGSATNALSLDSAAPRPSTPPAASNNDIASADPAIDRPTARSGAS